MGKHHKAEFRTLYEDIVTDYLQDTNIENTEIDVWLDATFSALSKTTYKVIDTELVDENKFVVTLKVEGIRESEIMLDIVEDMSEKGMEVITESGNRRIDMDVLVKHFAESELAEPVEVEVDVYLDGEGEFPTTPYNLPIFGTFIQ